MVCECQNQEQERLRESMWDEKTRRKAICYLVGLSLKAKSKEEIHIEYRMELRRRGWASIVP